MLSTSLPSLHRVCYFHPSLLHSGPPQLDNTVSALRHQDATANSPLWRHAELLVITAMMSLIINQTQPVGPHTGDQARDAFKGNKLNSILAVSEQLIDTHCTAPTQPSCMSMMPPSIYAFTL